MGTFRITRKVAMRSVVAIIAAWLIVITVLIALQPDVGVASPGQLRDEFSNALNSRNRDALESLIAYPSGQSGEFAESYLKKLDDVGAKSITVSLAPNDQLPTRARVTGVRDDGKEFSYDMAIAQGKDGWRIELTPPL